MYCRYAIQFLRPIPLCIVFTGFSAFQAYAVYGKDKRVFFFVTIIGAINPILNVASFVPLVTLRALNCSSIIALLCPFKPCILHLRAAEKTEMPSTSNCEFCRKLGISKLYAYGTDTQQL